MHACEIIQQERLARGQTFLQRHVTGHQRLWVYIYMYIYMYVWLSMYHYIYIYKYIYIYNICIQYIYISNYRYNCILIYIYIYLYTHDLVGWIRKRSGCRSQMVSLKMSRSRWSDKAAKSTTSPGHADGSIDINEWGHPRIYIQLYMIIYVYIYIVPSVYI